VREVPLPEWRAVQPRHEAVALPGGAFRMGSDDGLMPADGEGPSRVVRVKPFAIDRAPVTNARFADFVSQTGYVTEAERFGWSYVFFQFLPPDHPPTQGVLGAEWWRRVPGACWSRPEGGTSGLDGRLDHPVVHVSWNDARAFASWAGGRLPSEAEWEYAARGGLEGKRFPWGDAEPDDEAVFPCNIWQGSFPHVNLCGDGYAGTAPAAAYGPNGFGLHNMVGNIWEWCEDAFRLRSLKRQAREANRLAASEGRRVMKGGSYLCHRSYCYRYRIAARSGNSPDSTTGHLGFRLAYDLG